MSLDWGLRISQPGKDVLTGTDPEMVFSSKFDNLKIHSRGSGSIYDSTGRTVTIAHNLGYVPMFVVHSQADALFNSVTGMTGRYMIAPIQPIATDIGSPYYWNNRMTRVWADTTNIYIKLDDDYGYKYSFAEGTYDFDMAQLSGYGIFGVGKESGDVRDGALRFTNINETGSVYKATIGIYLGSALSNTTPVKTFGIDENDTSDFTSYPFGRSTTDAYIENSRDSGIGAGSVWAYGVTSIFNEILGRGGWSSGNHMGFLMYNNGSTDNTKILTMYDDDGFPFYTPLTYLKWLKSDLLTTYRYTIFENKMV